MPLNDLTGNVIEPELGRYILAELSDLNEDFIALLLAHGTRTAIGGLNSRATSALKTLSKPATRRLGSCAFALFDLRLQDEALWQALRNGQPHPTAGNENDISAADRDRIRLFILSALMYLRHLANINHFFAKLSFDASPKVLQHISELQLHQLRQIANHHPRLLNCRFSNYPEAWTDLLQLARRNDTEAMLPAKILGYQHLAQPQCG